MTDKVGEHRLPYEKRVELAVKRFKLPAQEVEDLLKAYETACRRHHWKQLRQNKDARRAVQKFLDALRRLEAANAQLPPPLRLKSTPAELQHTGLLCAIILSHRPKSAAGPDHFEQETAAAFARTLLEKHGRPRTTTKRSEWCRLSALLYGDPTADFHHTCRKVRDWVPTFMAGAEARAAALKARIERNKKL